MRAGDAWTVRMLLFDPVPFAQHDPLVLWVESECQTFHATLVWLHPEIEPLGQKLLDGCVNIVAIESDVAETAGSRWWACHQTPGVFL